MPIHSPIIIITTIFSLLPFSTAYTATYSFPKLDSSSVISNIDLTSDGRILAYIEYNWGNNDNKVEIYKFVNNKFQFFQSVTTTGNYTYSLGLSDDGRWLIVGHIHKGQYGSNLEFYKFEDEYGQYRLFSNETFPHQFYTIAFSPQSTHLLLAGPFSPTATIYKLIDNAYQQWSNITLQNQTDIWSFDISRDAEYVILGGNDNVYIYHFEAEEDEEGIYTLERVVLGYDWWINNVGISEGGEVIGYGVSGGEVKIEYMNGTVINTISMGTNKIRGIKFTTFSPSNSITLPPRLFLTHQGSQNKLSIYSYSTFYSSYEHSESHNFIDELRNIAITPNGSILVISQKEQALVYYECNELCLDCSGGSCYGCREGTELIGGICGCLSGWSFVAEEHQCVREDGEGNCEEGCELCGLGGFCLDCYYRCQQCANKTTTACISCVEGFYLVITSSKCSVCSPECKTCTSNSTYCTSCPITTQYLGTSNTCEQCIIQNCLNCYSQTQCSNCSQNYQQVSGKCILEQSQKSNKMMLFLIAGIAGLVGVTLLVIFVVCIYRRCRKNNEKKYQDNQQPICFKQFIQNIQQPQATEKKYQKKNNVIPQNSNENLNDSTTKIQRPETDNNFPSPPLENITQLSEPPCQQNEDPSKVTFEPIKLHQPVQFMSSSSTINNLSNQQITKSTSNSDSSICTICNTKKANIELQCGDKYHLNCFNFWVKSNFECKSCGLEIGGKLIIKIVCEGCGEEVLKINFGKLRKMGAKKKMCKYCSQ